eukprot:5473-Amphidinium_carterae.1
MLGCPCFYGSVWEVQGSLKVNSNSVLQGSVKNQNHRDMYVIWRRALRVLSCFGLCVNGVVGVFPRSGLVQVTKELPDGGMRAMLAVTNFDISENSFTGMLPESGLREVTDFRIYENRFAGTLPDGGMRAM